MQYVQLRAFHAVAEHGGFSRAAEALGLTQPAISDQVRRLEQEFGVALFHRKGRMVEPTDLGRRLLSTTRQLFACEQNARTLLSSAGALTLGTLAVVADAPDLAVKLIAAFRAAHPNVTVSLSIANAESCVTRVLDSSADAAVTAAPPIDGRVMGMELRRERLMALAPRDLALPEGGLRLSDFAAHGVIFRESRSLTQRLLASELARHGLQVTPAILVEGREALVEAVAQRLGIGVIAPSEFPGHPGVRLAPIADMEAEMIEHLVALADTPRTRAVDALFALAAPPSLALTNGSEQSEGREEAACPVPGCDEASARNTVAAGTK
ncbi:LysR substrate-binding domain-containing protein [Gluconacetobacter tumulisoli]|uniref:LysR family transcriptional regulator n=1 Tax=Gluconacetobacter tumulisoli TaxID=1286189 RepID=A0A7W4K548_9PROT|nr:LysR substrate-binding domain-containing protein [Gluconacetobacter tumulisoli]MBB2200579.1 LysR family transcriptional regulator [Gluconacetobacter tumulisoli]